MIRWIRYKPREDGLRILWVSPDGPRGRRFVITKRSKQHREFDESSETGYRYCVSDYVSLEDHRTHGYYTFDSADEAKDAAERILSGQWNPSGVRDLVVQTIHGELPKDSALLTNWVEDGQV